MCSPLTPLFDVGHGKKQRGQGLGRRGSPPPAHPITFFGSLIEEGKESGKEMLRPATLLSFMASSASTPPPLLFPYL